MEFDTSQTSNANPGNDDHATGASHAVAKASHSTSAHHAGPRGAIPANAIRVVPVDGVVQLPAGTRLDAIKVSGPNLIINLPDGQVLVIIDGALHVPQIKFGPIHVSAANIAALIATQEPEPAAGAPQSSGGNFIETPGDIGDPFGLGNLLPPTEFGFGQQEEKPFILGVVDNKPEILIITADQPTGSTTATATVSESALPSRGAEPAGSNPSSIAETVTGTIQITSLDQPNVVTVNGTVITAVGQTVTTPLGLITITSITPGEIGYSYTLVDNSVDPAATETVTISVRDGDGDVATATLLVTINDDVPTARADTDAVAPNLYTAQTGNVITGIGTTSGSVGADTLGADGARVTGVQSAVGTVFTAAGTVVAGQYGQLLINTDGSYSYVRSAGSPGGVADVFTYQLTDGDGDVSTATLTINIGDSPVGLEVPSAGDDGTQVDEAGLPARAGGSPGSRAGDESNATGGVIFFEAHDGPAIIAINGVRVTGEGQEITLPTGTFAIIAINPDSIEYAFVLTQNVAGDVTSQPINVTVTDQDGDSVSSGFVIDILDDVPTAVADTDRLAAGNYGPATGNVITDAEGDGGRDTAGADGAIVSLIAGAGGSVAAGTAVAGLYGTLTMNADGSYSYVRHPGTSGGVSDVFTYTLTDGDGDTSRATLTISIGDGGVTLRLPSGSDAGQGVSEAGLPNGSSPVGGAATTSGSFAVSITDGPGHVAINGATLTGVGQTVNGSFGTLTVTSISPTAIGYSYTLSTASNGDTNVDPFVVSVVDQDGDTATGTLRISITDDVPTAVDDTDSVQAGTATIADGNVLTSVGGTDTNASDGHADVQGADRATVTSIAFEGDSGFVGGTTPGAYGTLTILADGSYRYTLDPANLDVRGLDGTQSLTETFDYTISDGDGDESSATLTVTIRGQNDVVTISGLNPEGAEVTVSETNLPDGSAPNDDALTQTGSFTFDAPDGISAITIGDQTLFNGDIVAGLTISTDHGFLTITDFDPLLDASGDVIGGTIRYSYELTDSTDLHTGSSTIELTEVFAISITDSDGSVAASTLEVVVRDDAPVAVADQGNVGEGQVIEVDALAGLLANDTAGADNGVIIGIRALGSDLTGPANGGVGAEIAGLYGSLTIAEDGSYTYVANPNAVPPAGVNDIFVYTLLDGDGDASTARLTIHLTDSGLSATRLDLTVDEAALPSGRNATSDAETVSGSLASHVTGGTGPFDFALSGSGEGHYGIFTLNPDGSYDYVLTSPVTGTANNNGTNTVLAAETFIYTVTDANGNSVQNMITIDVVDDVPVAVADQGRVGEGQTLEADAASGLLANDTSGADQGVILGVRALNGDPTGPATAGVGTDVAGLYGQLTVADDGSYTYVSNPNLVPPAGANDIFVYSLRDADGDISTTTLTIHLSDSGIAATSLSVQVNEAALPGGSDPGSPDEIVSGSLGVNVSGGTGPFEFILSGTGVGTHGTFTLNADGTYLYTLTSPVHGATANNGANNVPTVEIFAYTVTDAFGNTAQNVVTIDVVDDVPIARAAPAVILAEDAPAVSGNLLANDSAGADGATVTSVNVNGTVVTVLATGTTTHTNTFGTYTFQPGGAWSFDPVSVSSALAVNAGFTYTITDGDGDQSSTVQQISVTDGANPRGSAPISLALDDQSLLTGSTPSATQPVTASGQIAFTPGSDPIVTIGFGDVTGLDNSLTWTRDSATQISGRDGSTLVVSLHLVVTGTIATVTATLESNYAHHPDTTADDIAALGSVNVIAIDSDGDRAVGSVSLSVSDDVPTISAISPQAGMLIVDETNLAIDATADFGSLFTVAMAADRPGSVTYAFEVSNASGLIDVATGSSIVLRAIGNVVEGRLAGSPTIVAFTLTVAADGQATLDQLRAVRHSDSTNPDDAASMPAQVIRLTATVTDSDGDHESATINVGAALLFKDDGPSIHVAGVDTNTVLLTTQDGDTRGAAFDTATADLSSTFAVATSSYGADGAGHITWAYALALGSGAASTGLSSNGVPITLTLVSGTVVGSASGSPVFSVAVNASTGVVTLTQFAEIDHALPGTTSNYTAQLVELAANLIQLQGTATIVDRDGDSASEMVAVDLGGNIRFADDGPSLSAGGEAPTLVVDETNFAVDATADLSGLFATALDFGADGPGNVTYALGVTAGPSGLIDSLTGEAITLSLVGGIVFGRTSSQEVFRITLGAGGAVTFDQSRAILHTPDSGPDQVRFLQGSNLITLTATATDGDGDTARSTADITGHFAIRDDTPTAVNDEDNVAREGQTFADGNVLTGLGGTDDNGTDGAPDSAGADGGLRVSGLAFGATAGTLGTALAGEYGFLTLAADGSYRYQLDAADPAVAALNARQTLTDTFRYTVMDADGDTSTATITITITGANDFPIARADTNWVLDGASGSDPSALGNVLQNITHPGAPSGSFADVFDNDPNLEPIAVTTAGTFVGTYGTLVIGATGAYTYTLNEDNAAVNALDTGQTLVDTFAYTVSDGLLSVASTLSVTVFGTNDAPTIGTSIARVSEEGLLGGLPDTGPNATLDTTNSTSFSGVLAIADLDAGETLTATLGNPGPVLTAGGVPVTWTGVGTGALIGSAGSAEVIRVTLAPNGAYTVTLSHSVDHANVTLEDLREFNVPVSVSDGTVTTVNANAIQIAIEDDAPTAVSETGSSTQPQQDVNTLFILDFSDSIDNGELDTMLGAVKNALTQLDTAASGVLGIRFVVFSSGSFASPSFTTAAAANLYLDSLNPNLGGERPSQELPPTGIGLNTNYTGAIQTALANFSAVPGASNQVFFLSDGNPNVQTQFGGSPPRVVNSLQTATATAWNAFVDSNHVNVTAIGIDNNPLQPLNIQRLADVDLNDAPNNVPILVAGFNDLVATLLAVIVPSAVSGDLDANDAYGADGGHLHSIMIGAVTYTWDGASSIAVSTGGAISGTSLAAITTPMGGALTLNFATGQYNYQPPSPITVTATEVFSYTLIDRDGDTATASLSVTITALAPPIALDLDGDGVEFVSSAAGVHFDYAGDGAAESTAWVGPDDGLLVIDKNGDGRINGGSELVFARAGLTDLQGLAASYDSNGDGKLDASDVAFAKFGVWHDANSNGVTDAGELQSLAVAGISSISLVSDGRSYTAAEGQVVVRGESIFTRTDGGTGRLADASFATNFLNDPERVLAAATSGMSTALLAAGLVAAAPLAAHAPEVLPSGTDLTPEIQSDTAGQFVVPLTVDHNDETELLLDDTSRVPEPRPNDASTGLQHFAGNDHVSLDSGGELGAAKFAPAFAGLLDQADVEPVRDAGRDGPFAPIGDQALINVTPQQHSNDPAVEQIKTIVADALEGRTLDLDALLGTQAVADHGLPQIQFHGGFEPEFLAGGGTFSMGNLFMPDMAEQHIMAQMEHAAATGHA